MRDRRDVGEFSDQCAIGSDPEAADAYYDCVRLSVVVRRTAAYLLCTLFTPHVFA
jgi:hypothetical protein